MKDLEYLNNKSLRIYEDLLSGSLSNVAFQNKKVYAKRVGNFESYMNLVIAWSLFTFGEDNINDR